MFIHTLLHRLDLLPTDFIWRKKQWALYAHSVEWIYHICIIQFISCFITFACDCNKPIAIYDHLALLVAIKPAFHLRRQNDASKLTVQPLACPPTPSRRSHAFPRFNPSQIGRSLSSDAVSYFRALFRCTFCTSGFGCRKCKKVQRLQMYGRTIAGSTPRRQIRTCRDEETEPTWKREVRSEEREMLSIPGKLLPRSARRRANGGAIGVTSRYLAILRTVGKRNDLSRHLGCVRHSSTGIERGRW